MQCRSYLGNIIDPLTLTRYNYVKSSPLNYVDLGGYYSLSLAARKMIQASSDGSREEEILKLQGTPKWRMEGEPFFEWKIRIAKISGTYELCVRESTQHVLGNVKKDPFEKRNKWDNFWFPSQTGNEELDERTNAYLQYLFGTDEIEDTNETYQIRLAVNNILSDTLINGYSEEDSTDEFIDQVYGYYLTERGEYANTSVMIMLMIGSMAAQKATIRNGQAMPDPRGSKATMYYTTMYKNGKYTILKYCMMKLQIQYIILNMQKGLWEIYKDI